MSARPLPFRPPLPLEQRLALAREAFEEIVLLCGKVTLDHDTRGAILADDLQELRDRLGALHRQIIDVGYGAVPQLVPPGRDHDHGGNR